MSKVFKVEAATFISLWDLEGCDVVRDLDLELTLRFFFRLCL